MKHKMFLAMILILFLSPMLFSHHGVASIGVGGLKGPGAPLETSSSQTLPKNSWLLYFKLDYADFKKYTIDKDGENDYSVFLMWGLGYAPTQYLSLYCFAPLNVKVVDDNSYNTAGFADLSMMAVLGFKYDDGIRLVPAKESIDDMMDWHFTFYGGLTLPTGDDNIADVDGNIDPGKSLGFGKPSISLGFTSTKGFHDNYTYVFDTSYISFMENEYNNDERVKFGSEFRINSALNYRFYVNERKKLRADINIEGSYLRLGRDIENGEGAYATGGHIIYFLPGLRLYVNDVSLALGVKVPVYTVLNESDEQQGAEGKEKLRFIFSFSTLF